MHSHSIKDKRQTPNTSMPPVVLTAERKRIIDQKLSSVNSKTFIGHGIHTFLKKQHKSDAMYRQQIRELADQIRDCPEVMKNVLGKNFFFFQNLSKQLCN